MTNTNERLSTLRKEKNLTQEDIASLLHMSLDTYQDLENGKSTIFIDTILALAKYYDVSINYITGASEIHDPYPTK